MGYLLLDIFPFFFRDITLLTKLPFGKNTTLSPVICTNRKTTCIKKSI